MSERSYSEHPQDILSEAMDFSHVDREHELRLRKRLEAALENERAAVAQRCFVGFMHAAKSIANESGQWSSYGGTDGESDCPREPGSKYARPEGLSAGARYLRGGA